MVRTIETPSIIIGEPVHDPAGINAPKKTPHSTRENHLLLFRVPEHLCARDQVLEDLDFKAKVTTFSDTTQQ